MYISFPACVCVYSIYTVGAPIISTGLKDNNKADKNSGNRKAGIKENSMDKITVRFCKSFIMNHRLGNVQLEAVM